MPPTPHDPARFVTRELPVTGPLRAWVEAIVGVEVAGAGALPLAVAPHDAWMLSVQMGRGHDGAEQKNRLGANMALTGVRQWTGSFHGAGDCITLFAMLTPLGVVELLHSRPMHAAPRIRAAVHELLDAHLTSSLESAIASAADLDHKLLAFAHWLEARVDGARPQGAAARRAAAAAMHWSRQPRAAVDDVAAGVRVSRRQLERDFACWLGTTPHHWAQVARVQSVSRHAQAGGSLADTAAALGFADQSHMTRVVKALTGLSPARYVRAGTSPLGTLFRRATGGGMVYL